MSTILTATGRQGAEEKFRKPSRPTDPVDSDKRAAYDQFGHARDRPAGRHGRWRIRCGGFSDAFSDIFGDIFGGGGNRRDRVYRGADLRYNLEIGWKKPRAAPKPRSAFPRWKNAVCVTAVAPSPAPSRPPAPPAADMARCASSRAFSRCSRPARAAAEPQDVADPCTTCHGEGASRTQDAVGQDSRRRRQRRPHPPRGRGEPASTAARRATSTW